jgi:hypothetical protein
MPDKISSPESEAHARLDQAVLQIMLDGERQRPISEAEVARIVKTPGHVPASFKRLRVAGLIHRWNDLATAAHVAIYYHEITQPTDPASAHEHHDDSAVLDILIARGNDDQRPLSEHDLRGAIGAKKKKKKQKLRITDSLDRLEAAGLIERRGGHSIASEVARTLDRLLTL